MKIVPFAHMREICKVLSLTLLRRSIIVHKLEILPKLAGFLSLFQHRPLRSQKKQTAREWKRSHLWDVLYTEQIFCHHSGCFELLDAIKALDNDCRRLYHLLLFSQRRGALSVTRHSLPLIETISSAMSRRLITVSNELRRGALRQPDAKRIRPLGWSAAREDSVYATPLKRLFSWLCDWLWSRLPVTGTVREPMRCSRCDVLI